MIYLDNAATSLPKPPAVGKAVMEAINTFGNSSRGAHDFSIRASCAVFETRLKLAELFGAEKADRIIFTSNATSALNTAILGTATPGCHIISTDIEHNSVLRPLYRLEEEQKISLSFVRASREGTIKTEDFEKAITPQTRIIAVNHASNVTGTMTDLRAIGEIARRHSLLLIADASQTAGSEPINVNDMNIGILCFNGHKGLMGPQGTGGMYIADNVTVRPLTTGGSGIDSYNHKQPSALPAALEAGTLNSHGIAGLSAALDFIKETGIENIKNKKDRLNDLFRSEAAKISGITLYGNVSQPHVSITALNVGGCSSGVIADALNTDYGIAVRSGAHCAPRMHEALGTEKIGAVRFSFSWFNTEDDVRAAIEALKDLSKRI